MGAYKVYNGTTWVDICNCNLKVLNHNNLFRAINPRQCRVKYYTGSEWCEVKCALRCSDIIVTLDATETSVTVNVTAISYGNFPEELTAVLRLGGTTVDTEPIILTDINDTISYTFTGLTGGLIYEVIILMVDKTPCEPIEIRTGDPE